MNEIDIRFLNSGANKILAMMELIPSSEEQFHLVINFIRTLHEDYANVLIMHLATQQLRQEFIEAIKAKKCIPIILGSSLHTTDILYFLNSPQKIEDVNEDTKTKFASSGTQWTIPR